SPRLLADVPVSVSGYEFAPVTLRPAKPEIHETVAGEKLTIPLVKVRRSEFSGDTVTLKTFGAGFEQAKPFDISLKSETAEAVLDLSALKTVPGDYVIGFYGSAVAQYRHRPDEIPTAEQAVTQAEKDLADVTAEA